MSALVGFVRPPTARSPNPDPDERESIAARGWIELGDELPRFARDRFQLRVVRVVLGERVAEITQCSRGVGAGFFGRHGTAAYAVPRPARDVAAGS